MAGEGVDDAIVNRTLRRAELRAKGNESAAEIEKVRLALRLQQTKALEQSAKVLESDLKLNAEKADRAKTDEAKAKANGLTALKEGMEAAKKRSVEIDKAIQEGEEQVAVYQKEGNHPALARAMQRLTILQELSARAEKELLELQFGFTNSKQPGGR